MARRNPAEATPKRFRIAFSFAGEKRDFVDKVARILAGRFGQNKILYDKFHEAEFARFDLGIRLPKLYGEESELIVPVLCPAYDEKRWTGWEWVHIYGLLTKTDGHRVMPSRFEHAQADGLSPAAGFIELDEKTPEQFAGLILERLALNEGKPRDFYTASAVACGTDPHMPADRGPRSRQPSLAGRGEVTDGQAITILHLSDMQFGKNHQFGRFSAAADGSMDTLLNRLEEDLDRLEGEYSIRPDLVAVTGDLAEWGTADEFDQARRFLDGLANKLDLDHGRFLIIPGNHDINRKLCTSYFVECDAYSKAPEWPAHKKWEPFEQFVNRFYGHPPRFGPGDRWRLDAFPDLGVVACCMNSTMAEDDLEERDRDSEELSAIRASRSDQPYGHFGYCGEEQYKWFADQLKAYQAEGLLRIALVHHNIERGCRRDDQHLVDADSFKRILGDRLNLVLHGHTHKSNYIAVSSGLMDLQVPAFSTGSAGLRIDQRPDEAPMQYQLLHVRPSEVVRYGRRYEPSDSRFIADPSVDPKGNSGVHRRHVQFHDLHWLLPSREFLDGLPGHTAEALRRPWVAGLAAYTEPCGDDAKPYSVKFLDRVNDICRIRFRRGGRPVITRRVSAGYDGEFLDICAGSPERPENAIVATIRIGEWSRLEQFCCSVNATYRAADPLLKAYVVVEDGEPTPEIARLYRRRGIEVVSFTQFRGLIDFSRFLEAQAQILDDERYQPKRYVTQRLHEEVGGFVVPRADALATVHDWLLEDKPMFLLALGDFGTGKSFLTRELARRMAAETPHVVPFMLELRDMEKSHTLGEMVAAQFARRATNQIDLDAFFFMLESGSIALLADGFDELAVRVTYDSAAQHLDTLLSPMKGNTKAKIVVTSRTHHFRGTRDIHTALANRLKNAAHRRVVRLQPFNETEVCSFLNKRFEDAAEAESWGELIENVNDLGKLAATPRMLDFILGIPKEHLEEAERKTGDITAAKLYEMLVDQWLEYEATKTGKAKGEQALTRGGVRMAVTELAKLLWRKTDPSAGLDEMRGAAAEVLRKIDAATSEVEDAKKDEDAKAKLSAAGATAEQAAHQLGVGSLMIRQGEGRFAFLHQSVMEWLVADDQAKAIQQGKRPALLEESEMSELMADFFWGRAGKEAAADWAKRILSGDSTSIAVSNAELVIERLKEAKFEVKPEQRNLKGQTLKGEDYSGKDISNSIMTDSDLSEATLVGANAYGSVLDGVQFVGADLRGANLSNTILDRANLDRANLIGADLTGASIQGASFRRAKLVGAKLSDGALDGLDCFGAALPGAEGRLAAFASVSSPIRSCAWHPEERIVATGHADGGIRIWDADSGQCIRTLEGHSSSVNSVAYAPDGKQIASASADRTVRLWDPQSGQCLRTLEGHSNPVNSVAYAPDGKQIASASGDNTLRLWDSKNGKCLRTLEGHSNWVHSVAYAPDGKQIASASYDNTLRLWDPQNGKCLRTLEGHSKWVHSVAYAPDGKQIASASYDNTLRLWDPQNGKCLRTLEGHSSSVLSVAYAPGGKQIASASGDNTLRLWDPQNGNCLRTLEGHSNPVNSVAYAPDGKQIASASYDNTLRLWDPQDGKCLRTLEGHSSYVTSVAYSPDGKQIASASDDNTLRLWDPQKGNCLRSLEGHSSSVLSVAYAPDGKQIASASYDNTLRLWDTQDGKCLAILYSTGRGWVAYTPCGRYKLGGDIGGNFWHAISLCRFEVGELDEVVPGLRMADDEPFIAKAMKA